MSVFAAIAVFVIVFATAAVALHKFMLGGKLTLQPATPARPAPGAKAAVQTLAARSAPETQPRPEGAVTPAGAWTVIADPIESPVYTPPDDPKPKNNNPFQRIVDRPSATAVSRQGVWAAFFCAGAALLLIVLTSAGMEIDPPIDFTARLDVAAYIALGIGILRMSRLAAAGALAFYLVERLLLKSPTPLSWPIVIAVSLAFVNSIRATIAYHRFR